MTLLSTLHRSGQLRTLDHALAESLRRLDPDTPDAVLAAAALASLAVAVGHAGFDPAQPQQLVDAPIDWPTPEAWRQALAASPRVAHPDADDTESPAEAPLVYEHGLLYLRRYREYERRLADGLRRIGNPSPVAPRPLPTGEEARTARPGPDPEAGGGRPPLAGDASAQVPNHLAPLFARLFPQAATGDDLQAEAAAAEGTGG